MAKDYAKFIPPKSRPAKKSTGRAGFLIVIFCVFSLATAGGFFVYLKKPSLANLSEWLKHKKPEVAEAPKQVASTENDSAVHFDFYDELPNMQVGDAASLSLNKPVPDQPPPAPNSPSVAKPENTKADIAKLNSGVPAETPTATKVDSSKLMASAQTASPNVATTNPSEASSNVSSKANTAESVIATNTPKSNAATVDADDVSNLLAGEQSANNQNTDKQSAKDQGYVIELGVFDTEAAAGLLREAIVAVGFDPQIVKIKQGNRKLYQLQQGPFESMALAKQSQQRLAKRGIISSLKKV